jgi:hypothetical protein
MDFKFDTGAYHKRTYTYMLTEPLPSNENMDKLFQALALK